MKLTLVTHWVSDGTQALFLASMLTIFHDLLDVEIFGFAVSTLLVLFIFVGIDFITGVSKSLHNGESIVSHKGRKTVYKALGYSMSILFLATIQLFVEQEVGVSYGSITISFIRNSLFALMLLWEFHSVGENIEKIFGQKPRIFYFVEVTTILLERKIMFIIQDILQLKEIDEKASNKEGQEDISKTEI